MRAEVKPGEQNHRFTDVLDLQLLEELVGDWPAVRTACEEVFRLRQKHPWPPAVTVFRSWADAYAASAVANHFPVIDVDEAAAKVTALIARIVPPILRRRTGHLDRPARGRS